MNFEEWSNLILENFYEETEDGVLTESKYERFFDEQLLSESIEKKYVIRKGKPKILYRSTNPQYKVVVVKGVPEERKLTSKEHLARSLGRMKASKKIELKSKESTKKRLASMELKKDDKKE